ncbi:acyl-CoA dehydrogenase [Gordonia jinghuaiqii]|uniref:Acyl-CoA/acyl-ACP dehydrogenase n=1 Tax=Gordonia jinghuaiqii TaxID=2758710 RepID=A0A7D7LVP5_9ACTN|nr:acyl-CoA dehydrogenase family protein [Gordonia jinghuaiqii]MCR5978400.1 acyl-CoA dehydrogenase [Gordonia jinghuaiqii]QMT02741.1 acyl-CoA/acyl-ACP dehydrogenase [Gordonia jinghuaiqii]
MSIVFEEEHHAFRASIRQFFQSNFDSASTRVQMESVSGFERATWQRMADELGLQGLSLPEEFGGSGAGPVEQLLVWEEMGRAIVGTPYLSTVGLTANILRMADDSVTKKECLSGIASGSVIATVALRNAAGARLDEFTAKVTRRGDEYLLSGTATYVPDGHVADVVVVEADHNGSASLFAVDTRRGGVRAEQLVTADMTRKQAHLHFDDVQVTRVATDDVDRVITRGVALATVAIAAEQLGGAQACLDVAVEYAGTRSQFGRRIGSFQAIKHRCADMLTAIEVARSAVYHATDLAAADDVDWGAFFLAAPTAKAMAAEAYTYSARQNIQIHGGIGCTWEHDAHLHYRRAHSSATLLGGIDHQRRLLADRLGI